MKNTQIPDSSSIMIDVVNAVETYLQLENLYLDKKVKKLSSMGTPEFIMDDINESISFNRNALQKIKLTASGIMAAY